MRRISSILTLPILLLCAGLGTGCATTVHPNAKPIDPVPVFLTDYGVHSSLMLPTSDGRYVEYSFGDFGYAALNRGGPHNAIGALLVSGQSGIGRRFLTVRAGEEAPIPPAWAPKSVQKFYANRFEVSALVKELDARFRKDDSGTAVLNPITDTVFVKDDERYSIANNCNHMTGRMLRQLGCEVRGDTGTSKFKVVGAQQLPQAVDVGPAMVVTKPTPQASSAIQSRQAAAKVSGESLTKVDVE